MHGEMRCVGEMQGDLWGEYGCRINCSGLDSPKNGESRGGILWVNAQVAGMNQMTENG